MKYLVFLRIAFIACLIILSVPVLCQYKEDSDAIIYQKGLVYKPVNPNNFSVTNHPAVSGSSDTSGTAKKNYRSVNIVYQQNTRPIKAIIYSPLTDSVINEDIGETMLKPVSSGHTRVLFEEDTSYNPYFTERGKLLRLVNVPQTKTRPVVQAGKTYPLIIFLHGKSKAGDDLDKVAMAGLPYWLSKGFIPAVNNTTGNSPDSFIVLAPQHPSFTFHTQEIDVMIDRMIKQYHADSNRIYLTGLSAGGQGSLLYLTDWRSRHKIAAAAIFSPAPVTLESSRYSFDRIAMQQTQLLFQTSPNDKFNATTQAYIDMMKKADSSLVTVHYSNNGHGQFEQWYDPLNRYIDYSGSSKRLNLYEWFLTFKRRD